MVGLSFKRSEMVYTVTFQTFHSTGIVLPTNLFPRDLKNPRHMFGESLTGSVFFEDLLNFVFRTGHASFKYSNKPIMIQ